VRRLSLLLVLVGALGITLPPSGALADGDPASDVLIQGTVYTPVAQQVSAPVLQQLQSTIAQATRGGFDVRVALILDRTDLGAVPQLFGHPVQYAKLLSAELYYAWKGALIAVQPSGIGVQNIKPLAAAQQAADTVAVASPSTADGLAQAATATIRKLAVRDHNITFTGAGTTQGSSSSSSSILSATNILGGVLVVVLVLLFIGQIIVRRRRRAAPDS
jgi:hypothetical protein